jgi:hypothetical protein
MNCSVDRRCARGGTVAIATVLPVGLALGTEGAPAPPKGASVEPPW